MFLRIGAITVPFLFLLVSLAGQPLPDDPDLPALLIRDSIARQSNDQAEIAAISQQIGGLLFDKAPLHSIRYLARAADLFRDLGKAKEAGYCLQNIAFAYRDKLHTPDSALVYLQQARLIWESLQDTLSQANLLKYLGPIQAQKGAFTSAKKNVRQAIALYETKGFDPGKGIALYNLALVYELAEQPDSSISFLQQAIKIWTPLSDENRLFIFRNALLRNYLNVGSLSEAEKIINQNNPVSESGAIHWEPRLEFFEIGQRYYEENDEPIQAAGFEEKYKQLIDQLKLKGIEINP